MHAANGNANLASIHESQNAWDANISASIASQLEAIPCVMTADELDRLFADQPASQSGMGDRSPNLSEDSTHSSLDNIQPAAAASSRSMSTPRSGSSLGNSPGRSHKVVKRQRNTEAARRYRQRKLDKMSDLEDALQAMTHERDELKLRLARAEAEAEVLRGMVAKK